VVRDLVAGAGRSTGQLCGQVIRGVVGEPSPQVLGPGHSQGAGWLMVWIHSERAVRLVTVSVPGSPRPGRIVLSARRPTPLKMTVYFSAAKNATPSGTCTDQAWAAT
jgi:hypothetical protein